VDWTQNDLDTAIFLANQDSSTADTRLPDYADLKVYEVTTVDLSPEVDAFFDAPQAPQAVPATATAAMGTAAGMYAPIPAMPSAPPPQQQYSTSDREVLSLVRALEQRAKVVACDPTNKVRESAVRLTQVLSASGQLGGWKHVEEFMTDQDMYARKARAIERNFGRHVTRTMYVPPSSSSSSSGTPSTAATLDASSSSSSSTPLSSGSGSAVRSVAMDTKSALTTTNGKVDNLLEISQMILRNLFTRAKWVLEIEKKHMGKASDGRTLERVLAVLQKDSKWMADSMVRCLDALSFVGMSSFDMCAYVCRRSSRPPSKQ